MVVGGPKGNHHPSRKGKEHRVVEGRHRGSSRDRHHKDRPRELQAQRPRWRDPRHGRKDDGKSYSVFSHSQESVLGCCFCAWCEYLAGNYSACVLIFFFFALRFLAPPDIIVRSASEGCWVAIQRRPQEGRGIQKVPGNGNSVALLVVPVLVQGKKMDVLIAWFLQIINTSLLVRLSRNSTLRWTLARPRWDKQRYLPVFCCPPFFAISLMYALNKTIFTPFSAVSGSRHLLLHLSVCFAKQHWME